MPGKHSISRCCSRLLSWRAGRTTKSNWNTSPSAPCSAPTENPSRPAPAARLSSKTCWKKPSSEPPPSLKKKIPTCQTSKSSKSPKLSASGPSNMPITPTTATAIMFSVSTRCSQWKATPLLTCSTPTPASNPSNAKLPAGMCISKANWQMLQL